MAKHNKISETKILNVTLYNHWYAFADFGCSF